MSDTIFALSSGRPPAAVAIIRTSGPDAFAAAEALAGRLPLAREVLLRTLRDPASGDVIDRALVVRFVAPHSATGEDIVEYQCHGGRAVVDRLLSALSARPGLRLAEPGEFTRRALRNGRIDLTEAEALADLVEAETELQRRAAIARGGMHARIEEWRQRLVELSARAEAAIDYVGDEDETAADAEALADAARRLAGEWDEWLARPRVEPLRDGVRVVVAGPVNAGKSSLINAMSESERVIVTAIPGTTRDVVEVPVAIGGLPVVLVDTAGLRDSADPVEQIGVARAGDEVAGADVLLWLGEPGEAPDHPRLLLVHARADLAGRGTAPLGSLAVSAVSGAGLEQLLNQIGRLATEVLPEPGRVALNRRQAAELMSAHDDLCHASNDLVLLAEALRQASHAFDRLTGRSGIDDMLDALFARFCLGK